jgi:hypothetical protein
MSDRAPHHSDRSQHRQRRGCCGNRAVSGRYLLRYESQPGGEIAALGGLGFLRRELPSILATRSDVLSPRMMRIIEELAGDWRRLDERIDGLSTDITTLVEQDRHASV